MNHLQKRIDSFYNYVLINKIRNKEIVSRVGFTKGAVSNIITKKVEPSEKLEDVGNKLSKYTVQLNEKHQSKTIDGSGNYSFDNISDGTYYVFLKSKNRNYLSIVEVSGQIYIEKVTLKGSVSKDVSKNFDIK